MKANDTRMWLTIMLIGLMILLWGGTQPYLNFFHYEEDQTISFEINYTDPMTGEPADLDVLYCPPNGLCQD